MEKKNYHVVGVTFEGRQKFLSNFYKTYVNGKKYKVNLVPEDDNEYDQNAIAVYLTDDDGIEHHVGYISRNDNIELRGMMNSVSDSYVSSMGPNYKGDIGFCVCVEY